MASILERPQVGGEGRGEEEEKKSDSISCQMHWLKECVAVLVIGGDLQGTSV